MSAGPVRHPVTDRLLSRLAGVAAAVLAAPVAAIAAPFWATSALTRWLPGILPLEPPSTVPWAELLQFVPEVGWRTRPDLNVHSYADDTYHLTTDAEGWRGSERLDEAEVLVFGDSFAFGHGVDDAQMYTEHAAGTRVKAMGSDGYSMVHAVLWMERLSARFAGKPIVWMVYAGNDLYDNLRPNYGRYRMPYVRQRDGRWEIHTDHVSEAPWPFPAEHARYSAELARMCTPGYESDRALDAAGYLLERANAVAACAGSELSVLSVPRRSQIDPALLGELRSLSPEPERFDPRRPDQVLGARCADIGIPFVALADHLDSTDYQVRDIHWTPSGHEKVGNLIAQRAG